MYIYMFEVCIIILGRKEQCRLNLSLPKVEFFNIRIKERFYRPMIKKSWTKGSKFKYF